MSVETPRIESVPKVTRILVDDDVLKAERYGLAEAIKGEKHEPDLWYWRIPGTQPPPEIQALLDAEKQAERFKPANRNSKASTPTRAKTRLALAAGVAANIV